MDIDTYFKQTEGTGVLSTADSSGKVDAAIYARPHVFEDGTLAFIMRDRLSYANLRSNPHAAYLFIEDGRGYRGKRLFLTKIREEKNSPLIAELSRRRSAGDGNATRYLVYFRVDGEAPLVTPGK